MAFLIGLVSLSLVLFAANSLPCRVALSGASIDPTTFTLVRILGGTVALWLFRRRRHGPANDWLAGFALFAYAACFSRAYFELSTATGTLVLFVSVQATMVAGARIAGEHIERTTGLGILVALGGVGLLVAPGLETPSLRPAVTMSAGGVAWGIYWLRGKTSSDPIASVGQSFSTALPIAVLWAIPRWIRCAPRPRASF